MFVTTDDTAMISLDERKKLIEGCDYGMTFLATVTTKDSLVVIADDLGADVRRPLHEAGIRKLHILTKFCVGLCGDYGIARSILHEAMQAKQFENKDTPQKLAQLIQNKGAEYYKTNGIPAQAMGVNFVIAGYNNSRPEVWYLPSTKNFAPSPHTVYGLAPNEIGVDGTLASVFVENAFLKQIPWTQLEPDIAVMVLTFFIRLISSSDNLVGPNAYSCILRDAPTPPEIRYTSEIEHLDQILLACEKWFRMAFLPSEFIAKVCEISGAALPPAIISKKR